MKTLFDRIVFLLNGVALGLVGLAFVDFLLHPLAPDYNFDSTIFRMVSILVLTPLTLLVGFMIIRRVPGNVVGPLLILWSGTVAYGSVRNGIGPVPFALFYYYNLAIGWLALFLMVLHFPDGKIYPPGAAPWIYRLLGVDVLLTSLIFLSTATFQVPSQMANPFYLPALQEYVGLILGLAILFFIPILVLDLISPMLRYKKGSPLERQQIKWLALIAGSLVIYCVIGLIAYPLLTGGQVMNPGTNLFAVFFFLISGLFPPLTIGLSVLRYRLWDIDIVIRRTLVYSILTVILAFIYFGSVVALQGLLTAAGGRQFGLSAVEDTPVVTVISTLLIAALFTPLRRRIQSYIDRRFYRQKYDAEKVLAALSATMRDETDLDRLTISIVGVVEETMQPLHVSVWLVDIDYQPRKHQFEEDSLLSLS